MQYVGKLVSTVYNTITPNINPATLSGAIDVIVVERTVDKHEDVEVDAHGNVLPESQVGVRPEHQRKYKTVTRQVTELASTPFHVRFGKMSVLRPGERKVTLHLNNSTDPLPFAMKVSDSGEAFFVMEIDEDDDHIPADLVTSPILSAAASPITSPEAANNDSSRSSRSNSEKPASLLILTNSPTSPMRMQSPTPTQSSSSNKTNAVASPTSRATSTSPPTRQGPAPVPPPAPTRSSTRSAPLPPRRAASSAPLAGPSWAAPTTHASTTPPKRRSATTPPTTRPALPSTTTTTTHTATSPSKAARRQEAPTGPGRLHTSEQARQSHRSARKTAA